MSAGRPNKPSLPLQAALGPYYIERLIASGGMAEIYLARMRGLAGFEKQIALKVILPELARDATFTRMLVAEAKIAVALTHANILKIFDLGQIDNIYFITMEYVDGTDFFELLRRCSTQQRALPPAAALYVVQAVAHGLAYAHGSALVPGQPGGIIHRDISPQNILLSRYGEVKIADFGIAKVVNITSQTRAGALKGKIGYMSPEQAWGEKVDARSDLFSTGIVLYEALVGRSLYLETDPVKLLQQVRRAEIPAPSVAQPALGSRFDALVLKAVARDPALRFQSASELAAALGEVLQEIGPHFLARQLGELVSGVLGPEPAALLARVSRRSEEPRADEPMRREDFITHEHSLISSERPAAAAPGGQQPAGEVAHATTAPRRGKVWGRLQLVAADGSERSALIADELVIGRGGELDLTDGRVSRRHARVWRHEGGYRVEDLKSANGTFLNLQRVDVPTALQSGDVLRLGPYELKFSVESDRAVREGAAGRARPGGPRVTVQEVPRRAEAVGVAQAPVAAAAVAEAPVEAAAAAPEPPPRGGRAVAPTVALMQEARLVVELGGQTLRVEVGESLTLDHQITVGPRILDGTTARITRGDQGFMIDPGRGAGGALRLNGRRLRQALPLNAGDTISVGPLTAVVELG